MVIAQTQSADVAPSAKQSTAQKNAAPRSTELDLVLEAGSASCVLPGTPHAVPLGRAMVRRGLAHLGAESVSDDIALAATELIANAIEHGVRDCAREMTARTGGPDELQRRRPDSVRISLVSSGAHVVLSVTDPSPLPPVRRPRDMLAGGGRGLQLIESLSLCWGWTLLEEQEGQRAPGKSVWAMFPKVAAEKPAPQIRIQGAA
ncbi:ATP-binding protein [Kineosporia succinea]|uniref:Anti-sigma regulatory factor (Ser/Thr protein kinase) n=1 Tax=Kineosporia succinea TaxID=84632 RepID=A0ABT9NYW0_9ACTN|nr:ATP-binding protein [Kineosporia succinea]MDP9825150.1 anti-sigma regulatory factor (Ser/Thr protein kinase) [Kineosporia succinea]